MADMFDCGMHEFRCWARGDSHAVRWFGSFDPARTAKDQWVVNDYVGKVSDAAFPAFERGWNAAQAEHIAKATGG